MAGRYVTTKHHKTKKAHTFQIRTYIFRCSNCKNTGAWSDLAAIIQIHSICKEVFPLMPAWKLPSSWQPEAEENGRESASPKVNMAMETHSLIISDGNANTFLVICQSEQANGVLDCEMLQKRPLRLRDANIRELLWGVSANYNKLCFSTRLIVPY